MGFADKVKRIANSIVARERDGVTEYLCAFDPEEPDHWSWSRFRGHAIALTEERAFKYAEIVGGEVRFGW